LEALVDHSIAAAAEKEGEEGKGGEGKGEEGGMLRECSPVVVSMLHTLLQDKEIEVKKAAVEVSCKVLLLHGGGAASDLWHDVVHVLDNER